MIEPTTTKQPSPYRLDGSPSAWSAQRTNLARAVVDPSHHLEVTPQSGRRYVDPLTPAETMRLRSAWSTHPISCIRAMNEAIGLLDDPRRRSRYLDAALEVEIAMDRELHANERGQDLSGLPDYLPDGYTDYGIASATESSRRREHIVVDKEGLRVELLAAKREAVEAMSHAPSAELETRLRDYGSRLRAELHYHETEEESEGEADVTLRLSERIARGRVSRRHLAIFYQLRLQEAGVQSTMTKGVLRLFSLKVRHAWNVVQEGDRLALVDVGFADETSPLVLVGTSLAELHEKAARCHRCYRASPESGHRYQIRLHDCGDATSTVL